MKQLNNNELFDFTIANPPFGKIDKTTLTLNQAGSLERLNFSTQRLDHKILLETLSLRKDKGRSVFIIGSDSFYEAGVVKGGSKNLLNYLYDNYNVEAAVELDGSLYKKQGTRVNVRVLVIGDLLENNRTYEVPHELPIINNVQDLWRWSENVLQKRLQPELSYDEPSPSINQSESVISEANLDQNLDVVDDADFLTSALDSYLNDQIVPDESGNVGDLNKPDDDDFFGNEEEDTAVKPLSTGDEHQNNEILDLEIVEDESQAQEIIFESKSLQVAYVPVSQLSLPETMLPADQAILIKQAQDNQIKKILLLAEVNHELQKSIDLANNNPFDGFLLYKLQYSDLSSLSKAFSAEQVDAVTSAILSIENDRSYILGDQTGIGKGRSLAGMLRYSLINGFRPVFFTRNAQLFNDLWRDIVDTGTDKFISNPFIFNSDGFITHKDKVVYSPMKTSDIYNLDRIGNQFDIIFSTYSQFSGRSGKKENLFLSSIDKNTLLFLDESHVAASGESNISRFLSVVKERTGPTYHSSATDRKKANNLLFYSDIFPASFKGQLKSLIENKPSNELLEAISMALVKDGVFLRREHDFSKLEFRTYHASTQYQTASRELSDQLAQVLSKMAYLSGDVEEKVAKMNSEIKHNVEHMKEGSWQENRMQVNSMNFASRMHNISRQILLSVTTPLIIDQALESLKENRKPVIGLENTGESLLKMLLLKDSKAFELLDQINELKDSSDYDRALSDLNSGKMNQNEFDQEPIIVKLKKLEQDLAQFKQEDTILAKPPTIADLLENMVHKLDIIQVRDRYGQVRSETIDDEIYSDFKQDILDNIRKLPDIPLCPLDLIKAELESRGYKVGEISGREYQLKKIDSNQGSVFKVEVRQENNPTAKTKACNEFQSGILDAMIITRAGSTGLSLHAIPVNDGSPSQSDHLRQREFLTGQSPQAIDEFLQMIGRVDRKGQVSAPIISQFDTGLPIQRKFLMMHNAKLAELSANVTSNRENVNKQVTDVDLLNSYGDDVALEYLVQNRSVAQMLVINLPKENDKNGAEGMVKKIFNRLNFVSIYQQEKIIDDLTFAYNEKIQKLNEMGINPFVVQVCDWKAQTISKQELQSGLGIMSHVSDSAFFEPAYFQKVSYKSETKPFHGDDVISLIDKSRQLTRQQLFKHLCNFDDNFASTMEGKDQELSLSSLIKFYNDAQKQILERELRESIKYSASQSFFKSKIDKYEFTEIENFILNKPNLDEIKEFLKISAENNNFLHIYQGLNKALTVVEFVEKLQILEEHQSFNINFAISMKESLWDQHYHRETNENALIRVMFPKLGASSLLASNYEIRYVYPSSDFVHSSKLKYLIEDAALTPTLLRNVGTHLFIDGNKKEEEFSFMKTLNEIEYLKTNSPLLLSFDKYEPTAIERTATLLTGNIINALNAASVAKLSSQMINYTDASGNRQRAVMLYDDCELEEVLDKVKGLSTIQEAITYFERVHDAIEMNEKPTLPDFYIVRSNSNGNPTIEFNLKPLNEETYNFVITGSRKHIKQVAEMDSIFVQAGSGNRSDSLNLVLKGDLSQGTRSSQTVQVPIEKVTKLLTNLSTEFSTVKINNLDPDVLDQLKPNTSNKLTQNLMY
ncbi:strawberry notch C-terminal domain-containing protein [Acinetobacter baumannii]|uniref:strawberry notch C-terminal domain-containing protein n=1 Tax=Acinetobacter baumannii TaxID=470 RepID=UPI002077706C|nr:strawberry notch C-terminal domain-containing protein [Acinetobacter baumannii]